MAPTEVMAPAEMMTPTMFKEQLDSLLTDSNRKTCTLVRVSDLQTDGKKSPTVTAERRSTFIILIWLTVSVSYLSYLFHLSPVQELRLRAPNTERVRRQNKTSLNVNQEDPRVTSDNLIG